jgi:probable rRNA maturation factor
MIHLRLDRSINRVEVNARKRLLRYTAQQTLALAGFPKTCELTLLITDDERLRRLNHQFRNVDAPTDVLAFPANEADPETGKSYLGDIVISYTRAVVQASDHGHSTEDELTLLTIHGVLHLLGYDHGNEDEKKRMWKIQQELLEGMGCKISNPEYD